MRQREREREREREEEEEEEEEDAERGEKIRLVVFASRRARSFFPEKEVCFFSLSLSLSLLSQRKSIKRTPRALFFPRPLFPPNQPTMFAEAAIVVGALLCAKAGAVTYAYVYHRETFDQQCANCERATRGFDFSGKEEDEEETLVVEKGGERIEEPAAPKRMQDLKKGRSFKKMFSMKKKDKKKGGGGSGGESDDGGFDAKEL